MARMPTATGSLLKAILMFVLMVLLFNFGQEAKVLERTIYKDGKAYQVRVDPLDPSFEQEIKQAKRKAWPFYGGAVICGLAGIGFVRQFLRIHRRSQLRYPYDYTRGP